MYFKERLGFVLLICGYGVLCKPINVEVGSCDPKATELLGDPLVSNVDDYSAIDDDDGGAEEAECTDPKTQADKGDRKDAGEDKNEVDTNSDRFQETELAADSGVDKRESRYQSNDYPSCDSKSFYDDADVAKYRDAFGGFPQDSGRGKRVKRSFFYH